MERAAGSASTIVDLSAAVIGFVVRWVGDEGCRAVDDEVS